MSDERSIGSPDRSSGPGPGTRWALLDSPKTPASEHHKPFNYKRLSAIAAVAIVLCAAGLAGWWLMPPHREGSGPAAGSRQGREDVLRKKREVWAERVEPALAAADARTARAIDQSVRAVLDFLAERQAGTRAFAETMLSLRSKWALVKSKAPAFAGGDDQAHIRFLNDKFSELVFSDAEFRSALESAVTAYLGSVQAAENELLVTVRADMADIPLEALPAARSEQLFRNEFETLARQISPAVARELGVDVVREMSSFVASEIATTVLTNLAARLGVSSGLMVAGVSTSWATFGLSIVAAIVVDQVVCWIADEVRDPAGELEGRMNRLLADIGRLVIEGDGYSPGLRAQLNAFDRARSYVRRTALERLILGQDAPGPASRPHGEQGSSLQHFNTKGR